MLAKLALSVLVVTGVLCSGVQGQTFQQRSSAYSPVSYKSQDDEKDPTAALQEQIKKMELRLRELENDVEKKIDTQPKSAKSDTKTDKEMAERLAKLEKGVESQGKSLDKLEDLPGQILFHGHKSPKMQFFGRIHLDYWSFPKVDNTIFPLEGGNPQDRFNFRRLRIGIKGDLNDNMFYKYEGEFAGGEDPSYRDAYIGFKDVPYLHTVIIGNHKRPYGLDHLNSSRHNVFIERPFIVEAFNQDSRRLGISSNILTEDKSWNIRYGVWNQQLTQTASGYVGDHYQLEFAGRVAKTAWYDESSGGRGWAHFAVSGSAGVPDGRPGSTNNQARYRTRPEARSSGRWLDTGRIAGADSNYLIGLETAFNVGQFNFTGEYMRNNVDRRDAVGEDVAFDGYYAQVSYFLTGEHRTWERKTGTLGRIKPIENFFLVRDCECNTQSGWGAWEVSGRYSHADLNDFDIRGGEADSYTFGLNWYWNPYARMQFNYIIGENENAPGVGGFGDYEIFGLRMMVDF
ncbi:MAG: OprO/OprP family phosphate-selective porin [Mariniblastus sp.]